MDSIIDNHPSGTDPPPLSPQTSPSTTNHALPQHQLIDLNSDLNKDAEFSDWSGKLNNANGDLKALKRLVVAVLKSLTSAASKTLLQTEALSWREAETVVEGFSEAEFGQWVAGVQNGISTEDWTNLNLVALRTYHSIANEPMAFGYSSLELTDTISTAFLRNASPVERTTSKPTSAIANDPDRCK
jgi:hypothetical protein